MPQKLKTKLKENEFYCVSCRARVKSNGDSMYVQVFKNKKMPDGLAPALRSNCKACSTNLTKFIKHNSVDKMIDKYGKHR